MSPLKLSRGGLEFVAMINPAELKRSLTLKFSPVKPVGAKPGKERLSRAGEETFSFTLVLDGTGLVPSRDDVEPSVDAQLRRLRKVLDAPERDDASDAVAPALRLLWGEFIRELRLRSLKVVHTLFTPDGVPLRARVDISLVGAIESGTTAAAPSSATAPAVAAGTARQVEVRDGDTLQQLCSDAYGDAVDPADLARCNDLPSVRGPLPAGTVLVLPPLARVA